MPFLNGRVVSSEYFSNILRGNTGLQGTTGLQGLTGLQGITGIKGTTGIQGTPGSSSGLATLISEVSVTNSTTETAILSYSAPANTLSAGSQFKFIFYGTHQNQNSSGTLTFKMYIGSNPGQIIQLASGSTRAQTYMEFYGLATVRSIGSSGTFVSSGIYQIHTSTTAGTKAYQGLGTTSVVNTTIANTVKITAQWQTASSTNSLLVQNAVIERTA